MSTTPLSNVNRRSKPPQSGRLIHSHVVRYVAKRLVNFRSAQVVSFHSAPTVDGWVAQDYLQKSSTETIDFDDISTTGEVIIQNGYHGFDWDNFYIINSKADRPNSGYVVGTISQPNAAFNGDGKPASFSSTTPFTLNSASFTGAWNDGLQIHVEATGTSSYSKDFTVNTSEPSQIDFNWSGITSVTFTSSGGTPDPNLTPGSGTHFAMDNLEVNQTTTSITSVSAGGNHSCALLSDGSVQCWGDNLSGELGMGSLPSYLDPTVPRFSTTPLPVVGISGATTLTSGFYHSCVIVSGGNIKCWGSNQYGQVNIPRQSRGL